MLNKHVARDRTGISLVSIPVSLGVSGVTILVLTVLVSTEWAGIFGLIAAAVAAIKS
jgi:hypothetical protein